MATFCVHLHFLPPYALKEEKHAEDQMVKDLTLGSNLVEDVLPVLDQGNLLSGGGLVTDERELGLHLPNVKLAQRLTDHNLA